MLKNEDHNPWIDVQSIYDFNFFCCPECDCKSGTKQDFVIHASQNHPRAIEALKRISDGSLDDVNCPWILITEFKSEDSKFDSRFDLKCDSKFDSNLNLDENFDNNILKVEINDITTTNSNNLIIGDECDEKEILNR